MFMYTRAALRRQIRYRQNPLWRTASTDTHTHVKYRGYGIYSTFTTSVYTYSTHVYVSYMQDTRFSLRKTQRSCPHDSTLGWLHTYTIRTVTLVIKDDLSIYIYYHTIRKIQIRIQFVTSYSNSSE